MHFHAIDPVQTMCLRKTEEFWQMKTESIVSEKKTTVTSTRHAVRSVAFGCVLFVSVFVNSSRGLCEESVRRLLPPLQGLQEVDAHAVSVRSGFWGKRLQTHLKVTIDHSLNELEKDGHIANFDIASGTIAGECHGHAAFDSDLYKVLEGAAMTLAYGKDERLAARVESIVDRVLAAQQDDGFLIAFYILKDQDKRWDDLDKHQLYNAGHFFEMAIEHQRLTGHPKVLNAAKRFADNIDSVFGPGKRYDVDGHQEVELALIKLYRATGERRYLNLARFFLDERKYLHGKERTPFDPDMEIKGDRPMQQRLARQDHKPVIEQFTAVGHAVRAGYMYAAMADIVRFMPEAPGYEQALEHLWADVVGRKMYITGGIGTQQYGFEGFGDPYLLSNEGAYCETCAAVAHVLWQYRMHLLKGEAKYIDVLELALINGVLPGFSIAGNGYFYENRLLKDKGQRGAWKGLSCCPTNIARMIPQIGGLVYAVGKDRLLVNLYTNSKSNIPLENGRTVQLVQETTYPWNGHVRLEVSPDQPFVFDLQMRIPCWSQGQPTPTNLYHFTNTEFLPIELTLNGTAIDATPEKDGYVHLKREWSGKDVVELNLPMPIQRVHAHENVVADRGRVALLRGPIVYCLEEQDQGGEILSDIVLMPSTALKAEHRPDFLGGVTVVVGDALGRNGKTVLMTAIPYYAWANRENNPMGVWIKETPTPATTR